MAGTYFKQQLEAKRMYESGKYRQREIARKVGVTEKTITLWVKKFGWQNRKRLQLYESKNPLLGYLNFLRAEHPETFNKVVETFREFQKQ